MGRKAQIAIVGAVAASLVLAAGAYAWDAATKDTIADGVRVGGVDVGGLNEQQAAKRLRQDLVKPLARTVHVTYRGQEFTLSPEELRIRGNLDRMVDEALRASREGGLPGRLWRQLSGGEVNEEVAPRVAYSRDALSGFVEGVAEKVNREPRDASVDPGPTSVEPVGSRKGITVREDELREAVAEEVESPAGSRRVEAEVDEIDPEVTTEELAANYPHYITVDRDNFQLRYYRDLKLEKTYTIAIGQIGYDTPAGVYHIQNKVVDPTWYVPNSDWAGKLAGKVIPPGPDNPLQARWMGFYDGAGIHGTNDESSIGSAASRGCIRMRVTEVKELYGKIPTGTPIYIG